MCSSSQTHPRWKSDATGFLQYGHDVSRLHLVRPIALAALKLYGGLGERKLGDQAPAGVRMILSPSRPARVFAYPRSRSRCRANGRRSVAEHLDAGGSRTPPA